VPFSNWNCINELRRQEIIEWESSPNLGPLSVETKLQRYAIYQCLHSAGDDNTKLIAEEIAVLKKANGAILTPLVLGWRGWVTPFTIEAALRRLFASASNAAWATSGDRVRAFSIFRTMASSARISLGRSGEGQHESWYWFGRGGTG
jgi:hypothetical protein